MAWTWSFQTVPLSDRQQAGSHLRSEDADGLRLTPDRQRPFAGACCQKQ